MTPALEMRRLTKSFGGLVVTNNVSLSLAPGERHALIGPNGAGKTTLVNLLTGVLAPSSGEILLHGEHITEKRPYLRARLGLARTFQVNQLFPLLTPLEAVVMAILQRRGIATRWWSGLTRDRAVLDEAWALLERLGLGDCRHEPTRELPYGRQRLLEIALALALQPRVLLLDEPAAGVSETEGRDLFTTLAALPPEVTVLLIDHDMDLVFRFAERITVLVGGAVLVQGPPQQIAADPRVREVYLGAESHG